MAITYKSQGAGVSTETTGASLSPACPAVVDANDILLCHIFFEGITGAPDVTPPTGWTLLSGPHVIETTIARHWVYGKLAAGTEDGAAVTFSTVPATTAQRAARIYSFAGRVSGSITDCVRGFAHLSHATDPAMPSVTTTKAGSLAVALVAQNDNNAFVAPTGETGGDWIEAVAEYTVALTPGLSLGIETAAMASVGTISGGTMATTNDPCGVIAFEVRDSVPVEARSGTATLTGGGGFTPVITTARNLAVVLATGGGIAIVGTAQQGETHFGTALLTAGGGVATVAAGQHNVVVSATGGGGIAATVASQHSAAPSLSSGGGVALAPSSQHSVTVTFSSGGGISYAYSAFIPFSFVPLDLQRAGLQAHLQECAVEIADSRVASSITDEYKRALGHEQEHLGQHIAALGELRALLASVKSKQNETLAYLRTAGLPAGVPSDL